MADSSVAITQGSGTSIDTRTETTNSDHRQVVVIGDPSTNAGVGVVANADPASTDYGPVVRDVNTPTVVTRVGGLTETAPTTDTASSGLNGRLQRVAQRITSLIALIPAALGQTTMANSLPVVLPSNQTSIPVAGDAANNATETGNPVKIGGIGNGTQPTAVTSGNRVSGSFDRHGNQFVRAGNQMQSASQWTQIHVPAANTQATKSQAAGAAGVRNVCTGLTATIVATATAPTAVQLVVNLIDGASGGTTYLWRMVLSLPATAGETRGISRQGWWVGTAATAMTLEFSAAGGANTVESVSMEGVTITE